MTRILKGENPFHRDCSSPGLDVTQTDCMCGEEEGAGSLLRTAPRITCTRLQIITTVVSWGSEDTSNSPNGFLTTRGPTVPPPHAIISTPLSRHQLPTTAGLRSGHSPFRRRAHSAHSLPASAVSICPLDSGPSAPPSGSIATAYGCRALQSSRLPRMHLRGTGEVQSVPSLRMQRERDFNSCLPQAFSSQDLSATSLYLQISSGLRSQRACTFNRLGAKPADFSESLSTLTSLYKSHWLILLNAKHRNVTLLLIYKRHWVKKNTSKHCHSSNLKSTCDTYWRTNRGASGGHPGNPLTSA